MIKPRSEVIASYEVVRGHLPTLQIYATCTEITTKGGKVTRAPGAMKHGTTVIAFVEDPTGYKIELIQVGK